MEENIKRYGGRRIMGKFMDLNEEYLKLKEMGLTQTHLNSYMEMQKEHGGDLFLKHNPNTGDVMIEKGSKATEFESKNAGLTMEHLETYSQQNGRAKVTEADDRYNVPKRKPEVPEELISKTIEETEIYRKAKFYILEAQKKQVGYGLEKYPNPLNANTWSAIETIDHILEESIDKIHYLIMLRIKLEQEIVRGVQPKKHDDSMDAARYTENGYPSYSYNKENK